MRFWNAKREAQLYVVAPGATPADLALIADCLNDFTLEIHAAAPEDGNYFVAAAGKPPDAPKQVPVVDLRAIDREARLREAALYVMAQNEIRK